MFQRLREDINSVFDRDPAARNFLEVLTNCPGLHALLLHPLLRARSSGGGGSLEEFRNSRSPRPQDFSKIVCLL